MNTSNYQIMIKFGELWLKNNNRINFINQLKTNLQQAISKFELKLNLQYDHFLITNYHKQDQTELIEILKRIPGISYVCLVQQLQRDLNLLQDLVLEMVDDHDQLAFEIKRKDKSYELTSLDLKKTLSSYCLKNRQIKINLTNPTKLISIDVVKNYFILYLHKYSAAGGLPVKSSGKVLVLLSGGIDSPVASDLLYKRGMHVDFLTFITPPHTSKQALDKTVLLAQTVSKHNEVSDAKIFIHNFTNVLKEISHTKYENYRITLMRRCFYKIANKLINQYGYDCIATGESLGQVASQTINSMKVISNACKDLLVLRPLLCYDKSQIIEHAKKIKTYEISILPYSDACSLYAPKKPITNPRIEIIDKIEAKLDFLDIVIDNSITNDIIQFDLNKQWDNN
ncbi:tRNA uracil 4-sulfurtransferase ThiI [Mycoplasmoides gallisepticum]|uniref:tRNA uracil 4-sulfurtransferase ThiI n=1 Tax=Mycoplasmoides gallisepticum TaxID=2096 RepID=UPI001247401A|nr:tRNA uracil 4-sulfurtransferase ThiI [Mycoplasmoides gallisepticum]QEX46032.1 tRNA 4-thiouridine(8) synthase ThiI [Mycoplasmoides gallisepticum]